MFCESQCIVSIMYVSWPQVEWMTARDGDSCLVFSGGLPQDVTGAQPAITVMHGKNTTVLEMEFCVLDFTTLTDRCVRIYLKNIYILYILTKIFSRSPYRSDQTDPQSILVLLTNDLVAIDCKSTGLLSYLNPYAMDFQVGHVAHKVYYLPPPPQESAVTCCSYQSDCPAALLAELEAAARTKKAAGSGWSGSAWPVSGGPQSSPQAQPAHKEMLGEWMVVTSYTVTGPSPSWEQTH